MNTKMQREKTRTTQQEEPTPLAQTAPPAAEQAPVQSSSSKQAEPGKQAEQASQTVVLDVQQITKSLPLGRERIEILRDLNFQILRGEFVALVGPSGSGKSTLLGILAGLDTPTTGRVLLDGVDITHMSESKLAAVRNHKIGMIFQAFNLIPTLTALENVEMPLYVGRHKGSPSTWARGLLNLVGLEHRCNHRPNQLSGGEQQRVAIARALATDPALIIADEPTGNLDAKNGENILKLIARLREQTGKTFIVATHDPVVAAHANRSLRIVDGQFVNQEGPEKHEDTALQ